MEVIARYLEIYKACKKKKCNVQARVVQHIHEYMKEDSEQSGLWKTVVSCAKVAANNLDQPVVISTTAYHVQMEKAKEFKELSIITEQLSLSSSSDEFTESKINLLHYGGFALHSVLLKREGCH